MLELMTRKKPAKASADGAVFDKIVEGAIKGDRDALYQLCETIAKDVLFRATYILGNRTDAEDVSQEALIRVCSNIRDLRDPKAFKPWLGRIITNEARQHIRKNLKHESVVHIDDYLETIIEDKGEALPHEYVENEENRRAVMEIIGGLPIRQREAVLFHYYDGLKVTEVAKVMGVSKANVSQSLALAREKLRHELEKISFAYPKTSVLGIVPVGALLAHALRQEAAAFAPAGAAWIETALAVCSESILAGAVPAAAVAAEATAAAAVETTAAASKVSSGFVTSTVAAATATVTVICAAAVILTAGGRWQPPQEPVAEAQIAIEGGIAFSGGIETDVNTVYVNPSQAKATAESTGGEVRALNWWITAAGSDEILYEGYGGDLGDALTRLRENGGAGEYNLFFRLEDDAGAVHKMGRNFYILNEQ